MVTASRQRLLARLTLAGFVAACGIWLLRLDYRRKISTDVLDLIPPGVAAPEIAVLRSLAGDLEARVMLFALSDPAAPAKAPVEAARVFAQSLSNSPEFAEAIVLQGSDFGSKFGRRVFQERDALLLPSWLGDQERAFAQTGRPKREFSSWTAERAASRLEGFLGRPEAVPMQELLMQDPLLLMGGIIESAHILGIPGSGNGQALVWARIRASPLSEEGQGPVFAAVARAESAAGKGRPGLRLLWSGIDRFAASRARIEKEITWLNLCSAAAVLVIGSIFLRQTWKIVLLVPIVACAFLGAWTASTLVFSRLQVLVFVIGSLLSGVAIDYGFYIYLTPPAGPEEPYAARLARLRRPLLASCLTTVMGFSLLLFSDLPFIRQVGFFVSAGLVSALAAAMLYFAQFKRPFLEARQFPRLTGSGGPGLRRVLRLVFIAALLFAASAPWRLRWRDDIRELDVPMPELQANEEKLRTLFGQTEDRAVYLTYGATPAQARERLSVFLDYEHRRDGHAKLVSLGTVFPTEEDWSKLPERLKTMADFPGEFRSALTRHGFDSGAFGAFFSDWMDLARKPPQGSYQGLYGRLAGSVTGPLAQLYRTQPPMAWFITIVDRPEAPNPPAGFFTVNLNELRSLNRLFARYRWSALRLSLVGLALVITSVFLIYRLRPAFRIALIPAGSCFFVLGILALAAGPLNLFHLLGAFLGLCLAHNYAIFSAGSAATGQAPPAAVRLSATCAAASFAVLACSHIPVVHSLGLTVSLIVLTALLALELEPNAR